MITSIVCAQSALAADKIDTVAVAKEMAQSERNFSKKSSEVGIRESFLQFFADDSVYLSPGPVNGKKHYTEYKDKGYYLTWQPVFASVASSGDIGITTGPWEIRKSKTEQTPLGYGQFFSVWKKQADNSWKVAFDTGIENPQPPSPAEDLVVVESSTAPGFDAAGAREALENTEQKFHDALKNDGGAAVLDFAHDKIRVLRDGAFPAKGKEAAKSMLTNDHAKTERKSLGGGKSNAGDFAYDYGSYTSQQNATTEKGHYISVWRVEPNGQWKLFADLQKKDPEEKK